MVRAVDFNSPFFHITLNFIPLKHIECIALENV